MPNFSCLLRSFAILSALLGVFGAAADCAAQNSRSTEGASAQGTAGGAAGPRSAGGPASRKPAEASSPQRVDAKAKRRPKQKKPRAADDPKPPARPATPSALAAAGLAGGVALTATAAGAASPGTPAGAASPGTPGGPAVASVASAAPAGPAPPSRPSVGEVTGLKRTYDPLALQSSVALVIDVRTGDVLVGKNSNAVLPIASITKLMTAMVVLDAGLPLGERLQISREDVDRMRHTSSRLHPGARLSRGELLQLALMASENRAANALGRHYPGGMPAFVAAMNAKARSLGMSDTRFVEPTGLSSANVASARDLARMVRAASAYPAIRHYSTARSLTVQPAHEPLGFYNTNRLISTAGWSIGLQKTGFISEAGNCLVMLANVEGRQTIFVLLDASGKLARFGDAQRIRAWLERQDLHEAARSRPVPAAPSVAPLRVAHESH